ncbi:MAG: alpha/beta hydrolase [Pseudomonadota bacterium]
MFRRLLAAIGFLLLILVILGAWTGRTYTPAFTDDAGNPLENSIAEERMVSLGGSQQYVLIRGRDKTAPLLLYLHGGPGTSAMAFNRVYNAELEDDFVFVNWDQRGTGYSYSAAADPDTLTLDRITRDLDELVDLLLAEFEQEQLVLIGHSWGSLLGLEYISRHPEKVAAYIGIGQMTNTPVSEALVYDWALAQATAAEDQDALRILNEIGAPPYDTVGEMMQHRSVVNKFGGSWGKPFSEIDYALTAIRAPEFSWLGLRDILRGGDVSLKALFPTFVRLDAEETYPVLEVPVYFFLGRNDRVVSPDPAVEYMTVLEAPEKDIVWFEGASHSPQWEAPARFMDELRRLTLQ